MEILVIASSCALAVLTIAALNAYHEWDVKRKQNDFLRRYQEVLKSDLEKLSRGVDEIDNEEYKKYTESLISHFRDEIEKTQKKLEKK